MAKGWQTAEHVGRVTIGILDILASEFHKHSKKPDDEKDHNLIIKLSQACGYQSQLYSGLQKSIEYAQRLEAVEKTLEFATPEDLAMGKNPVLSEEADLKYKEQHR